MSQTLTNADHTSLLWQNYFEDPANQSHRNQLVNRYLPLVKYHAQRVWARLPDSVDLDDLVSAGTFGLIDAIKRFDSSREVKFETFCARRIRGAMLDELRATDWVPRLVRSNASKLAEFSERQFAKTGRPPSDSELAEHTGLSIEEVRKLSQASKAVGVTSLDKTRDATTSSRDITEGSVLKDSKAEDPTNRTQKKDVIRLVTKGLDLKERLVIVLYYYEELTMKEIGETLKLSESRVSQMHSAILQRLRARLVERQLEFAA